MGSGYFISSKPSHLRQRLSPPPPLHRPVTRDRALGLAALPPLTPATNKAPRTFSGFSELQGKRGGEAHTTKGAHTPRAPATPRSWHPKLPTYRNRLSHTSPATPRPHAAAAAARVRDPPTRPRLCARHVTPAARVRNAELGARRFALHSVPGARRPAPPPEGTNQRGSPAPQAQALLAAAERWAGLPRPSRPGSLPSPWRRARGGVFRGVGGRPVPVNLSRPRN